MYLRLKHNNRIIPNEHLFHTGCRNNNHNKNVIHGANKCKYYSNRPASYNIVMSKEVTSRILIGCVKYAWTPLTFNHYDCGPKQFIKGNLRNKVDWKRIIRQMWYDLKFALRYEVRYSRPSFCWMLFGLLRYDTKDISGGHDNCSVTKMIAWIVSLSQSEPYKKVVVIRRPR